MLAFFAVMILAGAAALIIKEKISVLLHRKPRAGTIFGILALTGFLLVMLPDYRFGKRAAYYIRIKPFLIWIFLSSLSFFIYCRFIRNRFEEIRQTVRNLSEHKKEIVPCLLFLIFGILFIEITGLGKKPETSLWNKNGIPLQSIQLYLSVIIYLILNRTGLFSRPGRHKKLIHFLLIWVVSALIWSLVPLKDHFFAPGPYMPDMEYYPYSDAISYDIAAQTSLNGWGFNLGRSILKPTVVYMSYLTHLVTGNDYTRAMFVQSSLYAVLPAIIYLFGAAIGGTGCGFLAAAFSIMKEWNALNAEIVLTIHSRLIMSEFLMQIIFAAFCYAVFRWLKRDGSEILFAAIAGGTLALGVFTRYNFFAFFPAVLLILAIGYKNQLRALLKPMIFFLAAIMLTSAPMIIRDSQLTWGFISELSYTIQNNLFAGRYADVDEESETDEDLAEDEEDIDSAEIEEPDENAPVLQDSSPVPETGEDEINTGQITQELSDISSISKIKLLFSLINHGMHNIISSALTLPMEPVFHDTEHLYKNEGDGLWRDGWQGDFSVKQWILIAVWVLLFAAGCGVLIHIHGIAGFSILYFWAVYAFSIGVSRSSGGRYIVPCNWIPMILLAFLCVLLSRQGSVEITQTEMLKNPVRKAVFAAVLFSAFFTSMLLFELFTPYRSTWGGKSDRAILRQRLSGVVDVNWKQVRKQQKKNQLHITRGVVLYPRFYYFRVGEHGYYGSLGWKDYSRLAFTGINLTSRHRRNMREYLLPQQKMIGNFPQGSVFRAVSCPTDNGYEDVLAITIETPDGEVFTYVRDPLPAFSCPVPEPVCITIDDCR